MILGYEISGLDNKLSMYEKIKLDDCAKFKDIYDTNIIDANLNVKKLKCNFSYTYDGFAIVSKVFKDFCENEKYPGLEFIALAGSLFYWFKINNIVEFDLKARETEFLNFSEDCNGFEEIIGANPVCLKSKKVLQDGFFRTDICFGSFAGKSPLYLIGVLTKQKLEDAGFNEIDFEEIMDKYDWEKGD